MAAQPLWIFAYGSLIWDPGFVVAERAVARLEGYHRSFCMRSTHYRGSVAAPGLVLALDASPGAVCEGLALRPEPENEAATLAYLRARELFSSAYEERHVPVTLADGRRVEAIAYVIDPAHDQYCRHLSPEDQAQIIARAKGQRGTNRDYLLATQAHLRALGLHDAEMDWLAARVRQLTPDT